MAKRETLEIIVPIYNEQSCLNELMTRLVRLRKKMDPVAVSFIFVNDGSRDKSLQILASYASRYPFVKVIDFSRNFGHQMAITAAIDHSSADYVAVIDADLQDPPELIEDMLRLSKKGYDVVYGKRKVRDKESFFKLLTAKMFYRIFSKMVDVKIPLDTGDFRLMSKKVVDVLKNMRERHRFMRAMIPWSGFRSAPLLYHRKARYAGETKYPLTKMIKLAKDAIFSFSSIPLRFATYLGIAVFFLGIVGGLLLLYLKYMMNISVPGITATLLTIIIMSGIQILMIGVMGEYVGRIFDEVKERPLYVVRRRMNLPDREDARR